MEGLVRLANLTVGSSIRSLVRWTDLFLLNSSRGWELERVLVPPHSNMHFPFPSMELEDLEDDNSGKWEGFLWAAPKRRTSRMKRLRRKFGHEDWGSRLMQPKTNLRICDTCGHHYEAKHLCRNCYEKVKAETELIRQNIEAKIGHSAEDKGVVILYESEQEQLNNNLSMVDKLNKKMIVEILKPRPLWFSSNLLQKSTAGVNSEAKAVTPQAPKPIVSSSTTSDSS